MRLRDVIAFRRQAVRLIIALVDYHYRDHYDSIDRIPRTPGFPLSLLFPPTDGPVYEFILVPPSRASERLEMRNLHIALRNVGIRISTSLRNIPLNQFARRSTASRSPGQLFMCDALLSWPPSVAAQRSLTNVIRPFLPVYSEEAALPIHVTRAPGEDRHWVEDRMGHYSSHGQDPDLAATEWANCFLQPAPLSQLRPCWETETTHLNGILG
ncbi:hypothetical protein COOONC_14496 [Cooperia oncophora]